MSLPNRQAWSVAAPHDADCWCQFCFFHRLERVEAETEQALRRAQAERREPRSGSMGFANGDARD